MDSFDNRFLVFIVGFLAVLAFVIYILMGQTKRKLKKIGVTIALTYFLATKVLFPLGEAWQEKVLGPRHDHHAYKESRYVVKKDMSRYDAAEDGSGGLHPKLLEDTDTWEVLIGEKQNYYSIRLSEHDGTVIAECSPNAEGKTDLYILTDGSVRAIGSEEAGDIRTVWRGDIKKYRKESEEGQYEDVYSRVGGKPLTLLQRFFVKKDLPGYVGLMIAFVISVITTNWLFREKKVANEEKTK